MNLIYFANYIRTTNCYKYFLGLQFIVTLFMIIWIYQDLKAYRVDAIAFVVEPILFLLITAEIALRLVVLKKTFFNNKWNVIDLVMLFAIVLFYVGYITRETINQTVEIEQTTWPMMVLSLRYILQVLRLVVAMKHSSEMRGATVEMIEMEEVHIDSDPEKTVMATSSEIAHAEEIKHIEVSQEEV